MTKVYVNYSEHFLHGGEVSEGEDPDYRFAHHETAYYDYIVNHVSLKRLQGRYEEVNCDLKGDENHAWVVVVRYSAGDTFGSSSGHGTIQGVYKTNKEAAERHAAIEAGAGAIDGYSSPWEGYFNDLEGVEIHYLPVVKE